MFRSPRKTRSKSKDHNTRRIDSDTLSSILPVISTKMESSDQDKINDLQRELEYQSKLNQDLQHKVEELHEAEGLIQHHEETISNLRRRISELQHDRDQCPPEVSKDDNLQTANKDEDLLSQFIKSLKMCNETVNTNAGRSPTFPPPMFEGRADESFEQWQIDALEYFNYLKWHAQTQARGIPMLLTGRAKQFFQGLCESDKMDVDKIFAALKAKFSSSKSLMNTFSQLERKQAASESVRSYATDMIKRLKIAGITDDAQQTYHFTKGLLPKIASEVLKMQPSDIQKAEQFAIVVEDALQIDPSINLNSMQNLIQKLSQQLEEQKQITTNTLTKVNSINQKSVRFSNDNRQSRYNYNRSRRGSDSRSPSIRRNQFNERSNSFERERTRYQSNRHDNFSRSRNRPNMTFPSRRQSSTTRDIPNAPYCKRCQIHHRWSEHIQCSNCKQFGHLRNSCHLNRGYLNM